MQNYFICKIIRRAEGKKLLKGEKDAERFCDSPENRGKSFYSYKFYLQASYLVGKLLKTFFVSERRRAGDDFSSNC